MRESEGKEGFPIFIGAASTDVAINPPRLSRWKETQLAKRDIIGTRDIIDIRGVRVIRDFRDIGDISKWQETQGNNLQSEKRH